MKVTNCLVVVLFAHAGVCWASSPQQLLCNATVSRHFSGSFTVQKSAPINQEGEALLEFPVKTVSGETIDVWAEGGIQGSWGPSTVVTLKDAQTRVGTTRYSLKGSSNVEADLGIYPSEPSSFADTVDVTCEIQ